MSAAHCGVLPWPDLLASPEWHTPIRMDRLERLDLHVNGFFWYPLLEYTLKRTERLKYLKLRSESSHSNNQSTPLIVMNVLIFILVE